MRVSLLLAIFGLALSAQAHAIGVNWTNFSCSGSGAQFLNNAPFAEESNLKRISGSSQDREMKLTILRQEGGASIFTLDRVEDQVDNLGRVTLVYENKKIKLRIRYEGAVETGIELIQRRKSKDRIVLRANCNSD